MIIRKNIVARPDIWTTKELYQLYSQKKIVVMPEWLQRLMQKKKWNKNKGERIKSYLYGFFTGCSTIQPFYIVKIPVLKEHLKSNINLQTNEEVKNIYKDILEEVESYEKDGALYVLLDGQNRLDLCLKPFFEGNLVDNTYSTPFEVEKDGKVETLNNFIFTDITWSEEDREPFWNTEVLIVEGIKGNLISYVKSLQNLNDAEPWSQFERDIIEFTPVTYNINKLCFINPNIQALFGNSEMKGNVKGMSGNYLPEKKGEARMITEFVNYIYEDGKSGLGTEADLSEIIKDSMTKKDIMESFRMAKKYLNFVSTELLCIKHTDLDEKQKPFDKESLRGAIILLDILTNVKNNYHQMSPVQVKFSNIVKGKQLIEDFIKWHNAKVDKKTTPEDFEQSEPKPGTYVIGTRTINPIGIKNRSLKIVEQFIVENMKKWNDEHYFSEQTDNYKKFTQFLLKENNYKDPYTKLGKEIRLRDKFNTDHIMATRGPNNGTDDVKNLVVTNPRSNKVKSNSV